MNREGAIQGSCQALREMEPEGCHPPNIILTLWDASCKDGVAKNSDRDDQASDNSCLASSRICVHGILVRKGRRQEPERHGWTRERIAAVALGETRDRAAIRGIRVGDRDLLTKRLNCARQYERPASQSSLRRHTDQRKPERGPHCGSFMPNVTYDGANFQPVVLVGSTCASCSPLAEWRVRRMGFQDLSCTACRVKFWMPKVQRSRKKMTVNGFHYCIRCGSMKLRHERKRQAVNRAAAINTPSTMAGKVVVIPPKRQA